jgi:hypothetical protein
MITVTVTLKGRDEKEVLAAIDQLRLMLANGCVGGWFRVGESDDGEFSEFKLKRNHDDATPIDN